MAKDIKINADGSFPMENGDLIIIDELDEVTQSLRIRLKMWYQEWFLDNRLGVKYYELILIKNYSLPAIEAHLRQIILDTQHVITILEYTQAVTQVTANGVTLERLTVTFKVDTEFGESQTISEVLT
jgi:hypothetical protein